MILADHAFGRREIRLINKKISWPTAFFIAGISYVILILSSYFTQALSSVIPLTQILSLLGASTPVFSSSSSINFMVFAILIPIVETLIIFALTIDLFASVFNISLKKFSFKLGILFVVLSIAFLLFHVNAKGINNEPALLLVGIMAFISCFLIFIYKESRIAILLHIFANVIASISLFGSAVT